MATIIKANGKESELKDTSLASLRKAIGGYIELRRISGEQVMAMDEDGKLNSKLSPNQKATAYWSVRGADTIVGTVVMLSNDEARKSIDSGR